MKYAKIDSYHVLFTDAKMSVQYDGAGSTLKSNPHLHYPTPEQEEFLRAEINAGRCSIGPYEL